MSKFLVIGFMVLALAGMAVAHTGPQVGGEPAWDDFAVTSLDGISHTENELLDNPTGAYKGWWWVTLTNSTASAWSELAITPGINDLVAIVQGNGLEDEWGTIGNSIVSSKPGIIAYTNSLGTGTRTYPNGATGYLWGNAVLTLATPLAPGEKIGLKIYTDNSWYQGPYATSYQMTITPTAVPEPATLSLLGGLSLLGLRRRRAA